MRVFYVILAPWHVQMRVFYVILAPWHVQMRVFYAILAAPGVRGTWGAQLRVF